MKKRVFSLFLALVLCLGLTPVSASAYKAGDQLNNGFVIPAYVQDEIDRDLLFTQYVGMNVPKDDQDGWYAFTADQLEFDFGDIEADEYSREVIEKSAIINVTNVGYRTLTLPNFGIGPGEGPTTIRGFTDYAYSLDKQTLAPGESARLAVGFKFMPYGRGWDYGRGMVKKELILDQVSYTLRFNLVKPEKAPPEEKPVEPKQVTVSFDSCGGSSVSGKTVTVGEPYGSLPTPTREGYTFDGWKTNGRRVTSSTTVTATSDHTLYADWSQAKPEKKTVIENGVLLEYAGNERNVVIPSGVKQIGRGEVGDRGVFQDNLDIVSVTIPEGVTAITNNTFRGCKNLTHVAIPDSVTQIGYAAFYGCSSLTDLTLPPNVKFIDGSAFEGCSSLTSVTIPSSMRFLNYDLFKDCTSLKTVVIEEGLTGFTNGVFENCTSLTSVTIPASVREEDFMTPDLGFNQFAFKGCTNLKTIYGVPGSDAETFARHYGYDFQLSSGVDGVMLSFDSDGAGSYPSRTVKPGETYGALPAPWRKDYTFNGWFTEKTGGSQVTETTVVTQTVNHTLYAHWTGNFPSDWAKADVQRAIDIGILLGGLQNNYQQPITRAEFCQLADYMWFHVRGSHPLVSAPPFADTDDWSVRNMAAVGVVKGIGDNKFNPDGQLTREQAATILARLGDNICGSVYKPSVIPAGTAGFADNASISGWALESVGRISTAGIMKGIGDNRFDPQGTYTREQAVATIMRLYDLLKS